MGRGHRGGQEAPGSAWATVPLPTRQAVGPCAARSGEVSQPRGTAGSRMLRARCPEHSPQSRRLRQQCRVAGTSGRDGRRSADTFGGEKSPKAEICHPAGNRLNLRGFLIVVSAWRRPRPPCFWPFGAWRFLVGIRAPCWDLVINRPGPAAGPVSPAEGDAALSCCSV